MPVITDKCKDLLAKLDDSARTGEACTLGPLFIDLTFEIIGAVTAGMEFRAQGTPEEQHPIVSTYVQLLETYSHHSGTLPWWAEPHVRWRRRGLQRKVDGYLHDHVVEEFRKFKAGGEAGRDVLGLSFHDLDELTPDIIDETADQIKSFLFAGHDTTSKILQWAVFEISRHPRVLEAVRAEVDAALGTDPDPLSVLQAFDTHADDIFRALPYTAAVFRETLRRHTTAGTGRYIPAGSGFNITLRDGSSLCLDGVTVFICHDLIMLDEQVYGPTTWDFVPERWVTDEQAQAAMARARTDEERRVIREARATEVPSSSFRPFERGPRNCIGQELSLIEGRMILALLIRQYDFAKVDVGAATLGEDGKPLVDAMGRHISETEPGGVRI
jgi:cytochrome P450